MIFFFCVSNLECWFLTVLRTLCCLKWDTGLSFGTLTLIYPAQSSLPDKFQMDRVSLYWRVIVLTWYPALYTSPASSTTTWAVPSLMYLMQAAWEGAFLHCIFGSSSWALRAVLISTHFRISASEVTQSSITPTPHCRTPSMAFWGVPDTQKVRSYNHFKRLFSTTMIKFRSLLEG